VAYVKIAHFVEITTNQVDSGVGTDPVLITPTKAKAMIEKHAVLGDVSFYDLLNIPGILRTTL
jgi:hypothetical protein